MPHFLVREEPGAYGKIKLTTETDKLAEKISVYAVG
jgi:hypothetical protein